MDGFTSVHVRVRLHASAPLQLQLPPDERRVFLIVCLCVALSAAPCRMGVFDVCPEKGLTLIEIAPDTTLELVKKATEAPFAVAKDLKIMKV